MSASRIRKMKKPDGTEVTVGHYVKSRADAADRWYEARAHTAARADLRPYLTHIEDQYQLESCTGNALAGALEYLERRLLKEQRRISRLFIYYNARLRAHEEKIDDGVSIRNGVECLFTHGACAEATWPYKQAAVNERPHANAYDEALAHKIDAAMRVKVTTADMCACIASGYPVVFGLQIYASFEDGGKHGHIALPDPSKEAHKGGHTMLAVGYDDGSKTFIVRNSWGTDWGAAGYCYIPYDYVTKPEFCDEAWMVRRAANLDFG
jgi:C1A family cysteine protease